MSTSQTYLSLAQASDALEEDAQMSTTQKMQASQQPLIELDAEIYPQVLSECTKVVEQIRANFSKALQWYHYLGQVLMLYNLHGEQIKRLSRDLGQGFSPTTLYRCIEFARTYPDLEAFFKEYGIQSWRSVSRVLVKHRRNLHACKTAAEASEPYLPVWAAHPTIPHFLRSLS